MNLVCTACQVPLKDGEKAVFGVKLPDGSWKFGWTCCHNPVGDVEVVLASSACLEVWLREHPEHGDVIAKLFEDHEHK